MKAKITVQMDNAAFSDEPASELVRILRDICDSIEKDGSGDLVLRDINGNRVGEFKIYAS